MARCDALETMHKEQERKRDSARNAAMHALAMPQNTTDSTLAFSRNLGFLARNFEQLFTTKQDIAELRKTILQLAVMGKLTDQRDSDEPASKLLKKIAAEKKNLEKEGKIKKQKPLPQKWVHFFGPVNGKTKVDSFIGYAAHLGLIRGGTPSGLYC